VNEYGLTSQSEHYWSY